MRIKDLPEASTLAGSEFLAVDSNNGTKKATVADVLSGVQDALDHLPEDDAFAAALITERTADSSVSSADLLMVVDPVTGDVSKKTLGTLTSLQSAYQPLRINIATFSALPQTVSFAGITADMVVLESWLSNPSAQRDDWTVTTSAGAVVVSGTISDSTALTLILGKANV